MAQSTRLFRDNRGAEIKPGCRVAYNLSGQIAVGVLLRITGASRPIFHIKPEHPSWARRLTESKVRSAEGVLVLETPPEPDSALGELLGSALG